MPKNYDVIILGGGLAGLTLALQLKNEKPELSIIILEKRNDTAPESAHKVGESTVELGTYYLREVLDLKNYLDQKHLPKHGLRFFFTPQHKGNIEKRVELGPRESLPIPSHQIDRGIFENDLISLLQEKEVEILLGTQVKNVEFGEQHQVEFEKDGTAHQITSSWVADASGRGSFIKRKQKLQKEISHNINSVWFRVKGEIDIDNWSEDSQWKSFLKPGLRRLSTVHFLGKGYWVWFIPLSSGNTSIGIVADPRFHPFDEMNRFEKAMQWLEKNEPLCFEKLKPMSEDVLDFKVLKHFSHSTKQLYSENRWGITGEAGLFLDPFYSPGTDFISINNTLLSDLILRERRGEDVHIHTSIYEKIHTSLFENWIPVYENKYLLMGNTQIMVVKIFWDWATYWAVPTLIFTNNGFTNLKVLKQLFSSHDSLGQKFGRLNKQMQDLFVDWAPYDTKTITHKYIDPFDLDFLKDFHKGLDVQYSTRDLIAKIDANMLLLEKVALQIFRKVNAHIHSTPTDIVIDPYEMKLNKNPKTVENMALVPDNSIKQDVDIMWFYD